MAVEPSGRDAGLLLGVDTGGTFTDAVIYDDVGRTVVGSAKSPTTHSDLSIGIATAVQAVLRDGGVDAAAIDLVSLSTTLATNALVEGATRPAGLVAIGFEVADLDRAGLPAALGGDPVVHVRGGHDSHGIEAAPFDADALRSSLDAFAAVDAVAITSQFSVRNPEHELAAREVLVSELGLPVTCSHELSERLNGPKRAVTALLNARLISITSALLETLRVVMESLGIAAPLMVVRGDGSLVSTDFVAARPIETILSGPAASIVGAAELTGRERAVVADIGGTTTDVAVIEDGVPRSRGLGAVVGGHATMVDAVDMVTVGLGGDSEVRIDHDDASRLLLGPRRVVPLTVAASAHEVMRHLGRQLAASVARDTDAAFVMATNAVTVPAGLLDPTAAAIMALLADGELVALDELDRSARGRGALSRLVDTGLVRRIGFTPTDAAVMLGAQEGWDRDSARAGAELWARRRDRFGRELAPDAATFAQRVLDALARRSAEIVMEVLLSHDDRPAGQVQSPLVQHVLDRRAGVSDGAAEQSLLRIEATPSVPLVGVGASAGVHYPATASLLGCDLHVPDHAGVANAVGAVAGQVRIARTATVSAPRRGLFRIHGVGEPETRYSLEEARAWARVQLEQQVAHDLARAGAGEHRLSEAWTEEVAEVEGRPMFVEGTLRVTGSGRPRLR